MVKYQEIPTNLQGGPYMSAITDTFSSC